MTGPLLLGVDVAAIFRFFETTGSKPAALSTSEIARSSIISSESIYEGALRCDGTCRVLVPNCRTEYRRRLCYMLDPRTASWMLLS